MAEVSKEDPDFLNIQEKKLKQALDLDDSEFELISSRVPSVNSVSPGDIITFAYKANAGGRGTQRQQQYMAIAVSNARTGTRGAIFKNTRTRNNLFSCFLVDHLSSESLKVFTQSLNKYKGYTKIASYRYITGLFGLLIGKDKYRTFITTGRMSQLTRIKNK